MKKLFFTLTVLATMASCNNDELVEVTPKQAITFGNAFVDNATRAIDNSYSSTNKPESFFVYGTTKGDETGAALVPIFKHVEVSNKSNTGIGNDYRYGAEYTQYWIEGNTYNFAALVHADENNVTLGEDKLPSRVKFTSDGNTDLLHATCNPIVPDSETYNTEVSFTFKHLLSKVQISFENQISTNTENVKYEYKVTDVMIVNAISQAECDLETEKWDNHADVNTIKLEFGDITGATNESDVEQAVVVGGNQKVSSRYSKLLIPGNYIGGNNGDPQKMDISFIVETLINGTSVDKRPHKLQVSPNLEAGKAYNFILTKGAPGAEIKFAVQDVAGWGELNDVPKQ